MIILFYVQFPWHYALHQSMQGPMSKFRTRIMFLLCINFRLDERKCCSQASQYWHMRNCGFESRGVQNFSGLSSGSNAYCDDSTSLLMRSFLCVLVIYHVPYTYWPVMVYWPDAYTCHKLKFYFMNWTQKFCVGNLSYYGCHLKLIALAHSYKVKKLEIKHLLQNLWINLHLSLWASHSQCITWSITFVRKPVLYCIVLPFMSDPHTGSVVIVAQSLCPRILI